MNIKSVLPMPAPNVPLNDYNLSIILKELNCWCMNWKGNINAVYSNELSLVEQVQQLFTVVKTTVESQINVTSAFESLDKEFQDLYTFVNNYFDNLDVQQEINNKLETMVADGTLARLLNNILINEYNVILAGVKNDGSQDCGVIINELLQTYNALYFPEGKYLVKTPIELDQGVSIRGSNKAYTATFSTKSIQGTCFFVNNNSCFVSKLEGGFKLSDFTIRGKIANVGTGIVSQSNSITPITTSPILNNVMFTYLDYGINTSNSHTQMIDMLVTNCWFRNNNVGINNGSWGLKILDTNIADCVTGLKLNCSGFIRSKIWSCETGIDLIGESKNILLDVEIDGCTTPINYTENVHGTRMNGIVIGCKNGVTINGHENVLNFTSIPLVQQGYEFLHGIQLLGNKCYGNNVNINVINQSTDVNEIFRNNTCPTFYYNEHNVPNNIFINSVQKKFTPFPFYREESVTNVTWTDGTMSISGSYLPSQRFTDVTPAPALFNNRIGLAYKDTNSYSNFCAYIKADKISGLYSELCCAITLCRKADNTVVYPTNITNNNIIISNDGAWITFSAPNCNLVQLTFYVVQNALVEQTFNFKVDAKVFGLS